MMGMTDKSNGPADAELDTDGTDGHLRIFEDTEVIRREDDGYGDAPVELTVAPIIKKIKYKGENL